MDLGNAFPPVLQVRPSVITEIEQLHVKVPGVVETSSGRHESCFGLQVCLFARRFQTQCNEEVEEWMRDRQASMHDTTRVDEVLSSDGKCSNTTKLSMVTHSVTEPQ